MNDLEKLTELTNLISEKVKELNEFMSGKTEKEFKDLGITPLEQHLMSIQLMSMTSAMIAMNDRIAILRGRNKPSPVESAPEVLEPERV